jgi:hypothetical protein
MRMFYSHDYVLTTLSNVGNDLRAITLPIHQSAFLSSIDSGTNLSRLFEQYQLRYKPSKNVPRTTP